MRRKAAESLTPCLQGTPHQLQRAPRSDTTHAAGTKVMCIPKNISRTNLFQTLKISRKMSSKRSNQTTDLKMVYEKDQSHLDQSRQNRTSITQVHHTYYVTVFTLPP